MTLIWRATHFGENERGRWFIARKKKNFFRGSTHGVVATVEGVNDHCLVADVNDSRHAVTRVDGSYCSRNVFDFAVVVAQLNLLRKAVRKLDNSSSSNVLFFICLWSFWKHSPAWKVALLPQGGSTFEWDLARAVVWNRTNPGYRDDISWNRIYSIWYLEIVKKL